MSGTVTISDQRSYIKIELYAGKIPQKFTVLWGKFVVSSLWTIVWFLFGLIVFVVVVWAKTMTKDQEGQEHQQMKQLWNLWQMHLKKSIVQHLKYFLELQDQKLCRKMHKNQSQLLVVGPHILHDNARPYIVDVVTKKLRNYGWELLPHEPYSPDMIHQTWTYSHSLKDLCMNVFLLHKSFLPMVPRYSTHE